MHKTVALGLFAITFPLMIWGSYQATTTFRNELSKWPSPRSDVRQQFDRFQADFGSTDIVLLSWPDCEIGDPQLPPLVNQLNEGAHRAYYDCVLSGESVRQTLRNEINLSERASAARLTGTLIGPNGRQTCLLAALSEHGALHRAEAIEYLLRAVEQAGVDRDEIRLAGPASDLNQVDYEGFWSPLRVVPMIGFLAFLFTWLFVKQLRLALFISALSGYMGTTALTIVYVSGRPLNALVWTMPTLVLLLTTSAALHFLAYYRDALGTFEMGQAAQRALSHARKPILWCAVTTAAGLFSLTLSNLSPIQEFGFFGGVSVLASCLWVLLMLPAWLTFFPWHGKTSNERSVFGFDWERLASFCFRFRRPIVVTALITIVLLLFRLPGLKTGIANSDFFASDTRVMQDARWFKQNVCPLSTVELVLNFENARVEHDADRFRLLQVLEREFKSLDDVSGVVSAATWAPLFSGKRRGVRAAIDRQAHEARVHKVKLALQESGFVTNRDDGGDEAWRMTVHGSELAGDRLDALEQQLQTTVREMFDATRNRRFPGESLTTSVTGHSVLLDHVEEQFLQDLAITYATAFALISLVILFLMRTVAAVAVATPPNLFPAIVVLGGVSVLGISLNVGSLLTASVALGIAVDDTLHFLLWWRKKVLGGMDSRDAIIDAMQHCGAAMIQTTVVCGLSVSLYAWCVFLPTIRFGLLLSSMLFIALIGDLLVLPAILSTRLSQKLVFPRALSASDSGR